MRVVRGVLIMLVYLAGQVMLVLRLPRNFPLAFALLVIWTALCAALVKALR